MTIRAAIRSATLLGTFAVATGCESGVEPLQPIDTLPRSLSAAEQRVITSSNAFAFDLLRAVNEGKEGENVFISPLSVSMALGMTMNGAVGQTFDEMRSTLGFGTLSQGEINQAYHDLLDLLRGLDRSVEIQVANSVWHRPEFPFDQPFFDTVESSFDATVKGLDFDDPAAPGTINAWVKDQTRGRISGIIDQIPDDMVMYLINAVYFKGRWTEEFDRSATREAQFALDDGGAVLVPMMSNNGSYGYAMRGDVAVLDLPYGNMAFSMTILIPQGSSSADDQVEQLDAERWGALVGGLASGEIVAELPRFRIEYERGLEQPLMALGMVAPFTDGVADFSGMSSSHGRQLVISEVKHKTFVDVNEEGTEAAAATSVGIAPTSLPPTIRVDRPFVFAIRERFSGTILFIGKIADPTAG